MYCLKAVPAGGGFRGWGQVVSSVERVVFMREEGAGFDRTDSQRGCDQIALKCGPTPHLQFNSFRISKISKEFMLTGSHLLLLNYKHIP